MTIDLGARPKILVIRRDNIGDLVCTTPLFTALRARYPEAFIAALVNSYNAEVIDGNPDLNAVHAYTKLKHREPAQPLLAAVFERLRLLMALRREAFDCAILAKSGFDRHGLDLARMIGPRHIVGFAPEGKPLPRGISCPLPPAPVAEMHEVEVVMRLAAPLDADRPPGALRVFPSASRLERWRSQLPGLADRQGRRWVGLHLSAREAGRRWAAERFVDLIERLTANPTLGIVLLWSPGAADNPRHPGDDEKAATILGRVQPAIPLLSAPTQELQDLTAVLALCDAFIGADGGAMHLAAAVGLPMVALFENLPYKKRHWYPWQVPYELVSPPTRDIGDITVDEVVQAWGRLALRLGGTAMRSGVR